MKTFSFAHFFYIFTIKLLLMIRKALLVVAILAIGSLAYAQNNRSSLTIGVGAAVPVGKFGHTEINNSASGFAKTGTLLSVGYTRSGSKTLWLEASLQFQQNPLNTKAMDEGFSRTRFYHGVFVGTTPQQPGSFPDTLFENWKFKNDNWITATLLLGINGKYPLGSSNKVFARAKLMLGPVYVSSPEIDGTSTAPNGATYLKQTDASGWGVAFTAGGGIEYDLNDRLYFITNIQSFFTTSIKFKDIDATLTSYSGPPNNLNTTIMQSSMRGNAKQTVSTLNASVGLGLRL